MSRHLLRHGLASALGASLLLTGCIFVRIEGDLPEDGILFDIVQADLAPEGFQQGKSDLLLIATLGGIEGNYELEFDCPSGELPDYLDQLAEALERQVIEERDATILERRVPGELVRVFEYDGEGGRGEVEMRIESAREGADPPYLLEISWTED